MHKKYFGSTRGYNTYQKKKERQITKRNKQK